MSSAGRWVLGLLLLLVGAFAIARTISSDGGSQAGKKEQVQTQTVGSEQAAEAAAAAVSGDIACKKPCVESKELADEAITTAKLAPGSVTLSKLAFDVPNLSELQAEITARQTAERTLQQALTNAAASAQSADAATLASAKAATDAAVANEAADRKAADDVIKTDLAKEKADRAAGDAGVQSKLDAEIAKRAAADTTLTTDLNNEIAGRKGAISSLRSDLLNTANSKVVMRVNNSELLANVVTTDKIHNETIKSEDIKNGTIIELDLAAGSVTGGVLGTITDDSITDADIKDESILSQDIKNGTIVEVDLGAASVTGGVLGTITDESIVSQDIKNGTIVEADLGAASVTGGVLGTITDNSITDDDVANDSLTKASLATGSVESDEIFDNTITDADVSNNSLSALSLATNSVGADELADNAVDTNALLAGAVIDAKLDQSAGGVVARLSTLRGEFDLFVTELAESNTDLDGDDFEVNFDNIINLPSDFKKATDLDCVAASGCVDNDDIKNGAVSDDKISDVDAGKVTTGTLDAARIPDLDAGKITTGTLDAARIPDLDAGKITTGTLDPARLPTITGAMVTTIDSEGLTGANIQDGAIGANDLAIGVLRGEHLDDGVAIVTNAATGHIGLGTITGEDDPGPGSPSGNIAFKTITAANLADGAVTADKLLATVASSTIGQPAAGMADAFVSAVPETVVDEALTLVGDGTAHKVLLTGEVVIDCLNCASGDLVKVEILRAVGVAPASVISTRTYSLSGAQPVLALPTTFLDTAAATAADPGEVNTYSIQVTFTGTDTDPGPGVTLSSAEWDFASITAVDLGR